MLLSSGEWATEERELKKICAFIENITHRPVEKGYITTNVKTIVIQTDLTTSDVRRSNAHLELRGIVEIESLWNDTVYFKLRRPQAWSWWSRLWWTMPLEIWGVYLIFNGISMLYTWKYIEPYIELAIAFQGAFQEAS